jgi:hypothetical protein
MMGRVHFGGRGYVMVMPDSINGKLKISQTGQIVRWSIFFGLFFLFLLYMIVGYWQ